MNDKYLHHYRTLGIEPGCTQQELKASYHRLAREWHPDRFIARPSAGKGKRLTEDRIKEINHAYWSLSDYYRKHGRLPLEPLSSTAQTSGDASTDQHLYSTSTNGKSPRNPFYYGRYLIIGALLGLVFTIWYDRPASEMDGFPLSQNAPEDSLPARKEYFSVGSKPGDVYAAQGIPTKTENDVWHYGQSRVYFEKGVVTRWVEDSKYPLMVSEVGENEEDASPSVIKFFSQGSTKQEVRAVQGTPLRETDTLWEYRVSRVYFKNDRVTGWYSSPLDPLRVHRK